MQLYVNSAKKSKTPSLFLSFMDGKGATVNRNLCVIFNIS